MAAKNQFSFKCNENNNTITLQYTIPVVRAGERTCVTEVERIPFIIIDDFKDLIIEALEKRMQSCIEQLMAHVSDFKEATDMEILYDTKHGIKHFCYPSYNVMNDAIEKLNTGNAKLLHAGEINQIQKALYWVELKDTKNFSAGQLISALELVECRETYCIPCEKPSCCP
jgi:hypothetical protein